MQPFVSTVVNKLDAKGRVSVPAPFRQILAQQNLHGLYCIPSFVSPALEAFGETLLAEFQQRLRKFDPLFSEDYDAQAQAVLGQTQFLNFDDEGRVRLPDELIAHAGITERVVFIGLDQKFQLWDPIRFEPIQKERLARARAARQQRGRRMSAHVPVMLEEVMAVLSPRDDAIYVDATFGGGGYSTALLSRARCSVFAIDRDPAAIARGRELAERFDGRLTLIHGRFSEMEELLAEHGILQADGVAFDLGVSSFQFDEAGRGFSFSHDGPLDMRMDSSRGETAAELVNTLPEASLADLIKTYGEEKRARSVARAIIASRPIARTSELAEIVERALPRRGQRIHPATRTFQALRIAVNEELAELERGLVAAECVLKAQGRLAAVSFHSLEDRIVKRFLLSASGRATSFSRHVPAQATAREPTFRLIGKQPIFPSTEEIRVNPRARSARLRAAERTAAPCSRNSSMSGELA